MGSDQRMPAQPGLEADVHAARSERLLPAHFGGVVNGPERNFSLLPFAATQPPQTGH